MTDSIEKLFDRAACPVYLSGESRQFSAAKIGVLIEKRHVKNHVGGLARVIYCPWDYAVGSFEFSTKPNE